MPFRRTDDECPGRGQTEPTQKYRAPRARPANRAIWRQSSDPIDPAAPVTRTTLPRCFSVMWVWSHSTMVRPSMSSRATSRTNAASGPPSLISAMAGMVRNGTPASRAAAALCSEGGGHGGARQPDENCGAVCGCGARCTGCSMLPPLSADRLAGPAFDLLRKLDFDGLTRRVGNVTTAAKDGLTAATTVSDLVPFR